MAWLFQGSTWLTAVLQHSVSASFQHLSQMLLVLKSYGTNPCLTFVSVFFACKETHKCDEDVTNTATSAWVSRQPEINSC